MQYLPFLELLSVLLILGPVALWASESSGCYTDIKGMDKCGQHALPQGVCLWQQGIIQENIVIGPSRSGCVFEKCGQHALPQGVCLWQQGIIQQNIVTGPSRSGCVFEVRNSHFLHLIGDNPKLDFVVAADAREGGVYFPDKQEFYFSSTRKSKPKPNISLNKLSLVTNTVSTVSATTPMSNGMVLDLSGHLLVCQQGLGAQGGFIQHINLITQGSSIVADNWFGLPFNSPNDVVVKSDGSIWFTDPDYGWSQGYKKNAPRIDNQVYRISPSGVVDAVAENFIKPNGLAFSVDEKLLYVTDTGSSFGNGSVDTSLPHSVYVFDVDSNGRSLSSRRLFASVASFDGSYAGIGAPADGIKVDTDGRVYVANKDGIQVFNADGELLGLIHVPGGSANMGFVGKNLDRLLILNNTAIHSVRLNARGANLFYAEKHPN